MMISNIMLDMLIIGSEKLVLSWLFRKHDKPGKVLVSEYHGNNTRASISEIKDEEKKREHRDKAKQHIVTIEKPYTAMRLNLPHSYERWDEICDKHHGNNDFITIRTKMFTAHIAVTDRAYSLIVKNGHDYERVNAQISQLIFGPSVIVSLQPTDAHWKELRNNYTKLFGISKITNLFNHTFKSADNLVKRILDDNDQEQFDFEDVLLCHMVDILYRVYFENQTLKKKDLTRFTRAIKERLNAAVKLMANPMIFLSPSFFTSSVINILNMYDGLFDSTTHKKYKEEQAFVNETIKNTLINIGKNGTKDEVDQFVSILIAGAFTTWITIRFALNEVINNSDLLTKVRTEINNAVTSQNIFKRGGFDDALPLLTNVIKEALRLYPPTPFLLKK